MWRPRIPAVLLARSVGVPEAPATCSGGRRSEGGWSMRSRLVHALAPAAAARPPKGYTVVSSGRLPAPAGTQTHGTVSCPAGLVPLGGGVLTNSSSVGVSVGNAAP